MRNKYFNKKTIVNGIEFHSRKEAKRYQELLLLQRAGEIHQLNLQQKFVLIPAQYERVETGEYYKNGANKGMPKTKEVCVEKEVAYVADFVYMENGKMVVEDTKGFKTKDYIIKRKLMLHKFGIKVMVV